MKRFVFLIFAYLFLALALIGVFLPGLPTVPFLLLAAWFAARGSEKLHQWLYDHPKFGQMLIDWENGQAVSRKSKVLAVVMMTVSWGIMYYKVDNPWVPAGLALLFICVSTYLITRPEPARSK